jgi:hypothetical protein
MERQYGRGLLDDPARTLQIVAQQSAGKCVLAEDQAQGETS